MLSECNSQLLAGLSPLEDVYYFIEDRDGY